MESLQDGRAAHAQGRPSSRYFGAMFLSHLPDTNDWSAVLQTTARSQTAVMNLAPGEASGDEKEAHPGNDQVLVVLEGSVLAEVGEESARMRQGDMVVIPAGIRHRFTNEAELAVRTFSVYAPPVYPPGMRG